MLGEPDLPYVAFSLSPGCRPAPCSPDMVPFACLGLGSDGAYDCRVLSLRSTPRRDTQQVGDTAQATPGLPEVASGQANRRAEPRLRSLSLHAGQQLAGRNPEDRQLLRSSRLALHRLSSGNASLSAGTGSRRHRRCSLRLDHCEKILANSAAASVDQAAALSWIIHLVGDIQQPLHCVTLVNATYPKPQGDRGGNLFFVSVAGNTINLHSFWDSLPGHSLDMKELTERARDLGTKLPRVALPELTQAHTALAWSLEGRLLAIDAVYLHGKLPGSHDGKVLPPPLPPAIWLRPER